MDILESRPLLAMGHLDQARHTDWFAARLYLRACDHAGLMPVCSLDYSPSDLEDFEHIVWAWHRAERDPEAAWDPGESELEAIADSWVRFHRGTLDGPLPTSDHPQAWRARLRVARRTENDAELAKQGLASLAQHPERPQLLSELFIGRFKGPKTARARRIALRKLKKRHGATPAERYRLLRFWMSARDEDRAEAMAEQIEADGFPRPAARKPYNAAMERALGGALAMQLHPEVNAPTAPDRLAIAAGLTQRLIDSGRLEDAAVVWAGVREDSDSSSAASEHAVLCHRLGREEEARGIVTLALDLAAGGVYDDVLRIDRGRWRSDLSEALLAAAIVLDNPDYGALSEQLLPAERNRATGGDASAVRGSIRRAADVILVDDAESWHRYGMWLHAHGELKFSEIAKLFEYERGTQRSPVVKAVQGAWVDLVPPEQSAAATLGEPFPLGRLGLEPGEKTVVAAWASWCGPCRHELPALDELLAEGGHRGIALSVDQGAVGYVRALKRLGLQVLKPVRDPGLGETLGVGALPTLWLIDETGVLVAKRVGYEPAALDELRKWLEE